MATPTYLPCVEIDDGHPPKGVVIVLHGLGADGHDLAPLVPLLGLSGTGVRFLFPHAPHRPVTLNMGFVMPAWYDIQQLDLGRGHEEAGIRESAARIEALIAREVAGGVPSRKIALAGFSQGGAMALHVGLRHAEPLACIVALSTYLVLPDRLEAEMHPANRAIPVLQAHGVHDPMVPFAIGERARDRLHEVGIPVTWKTYPAAHEIHPAEIRDVGAFLREHLA